MMRTSYFDVVPVARCIIVLQESFEDRNHCAAGILMWPISSKPISSKPISSKPYMALGGRVRPFRATCITPWKALKASKSPFLFLQNAALFVLAARPISAMSDWTEESQNAWLCDFFTPAVLEGSMSEESQDTWLNTLLDSSAAQGNPATSSAAASNDSILFLMA